jgi:hypothetical protein
MCLYVKYLANMTQVSDVAHGPLIFPLNVWNEELTRKIKHIDEKDFQLIPHSKRD